MTPIPSTALAGEKTTDREAKASESFRFGKSKPFTGTCFEFISNDITSGASHFLYRLRRTISPSLSSKMMAGDWPPQDS
jgi:hypothetical protein